MMALAAALPLVVAVAAMVLRWSAPRAAALSILTASLLTATLFPTSWGDLATAGRGLLGTLTEVLLILLGGVLLSRVLEASGDQKHLADWVDQLGAGHRERVIVLLVLGLTPFAESVTGFGLGAVVAIPLLRHLGFSRARAFALGLMGLFLTVWGALSTGTLVAAHLGEVGSVDLITRTAMLTPPVTGTVALVALRVGTGRAPRAAAVIDALVITAAQAVTLIVVSRLLGHSLGGVLASLVAAVVALMLLRLRYGTRFTLHAATRGALVPYGVLVTGLLTATLLIRGSGISGPLAWLSHGSVWLMIAVLVATWRLRRADPDAIGPTWRDGVRTWLPVGLGTGGFVVLGGLLTATGMSAWLGGAMAGTGGAFPAVSAFLGSVTGAVAGSTAGANSMLSASQAAAARALGADPITALAVQNLACGVWTLIAPTRLALARAVLGPDPDDPVPETRELRWLLAICMITTGWLTVAGWIW